MKQHPLPQNITSYQFHLIGSMTLKQFLLLGGGLALAWIFYSLPIIPLLRLPLAIISGLIGILFAFVPYQDRPLDTWLSTFIKSIYSPTRFLWKKTPQQPKFLQTPTVKKNPTPVQSTNPNQTQQTQNLKSYLKSLPNQPIPNSPDSQFKAEENTKLKSITKLFNTIKPVQEPNPQTPQQPNSDPSDKEKSVKIKVRKLKTPPPNYSSTHTDPNLPNLPGQPKSQTKTNSPANITPIASLASQQHQTTTHDAVVNPKLPFPPTPSIPNVIVGMTLDQNRNILDGSIIEIRDQTGHPVRALKSNKLGQFFIATPLPNGTYELETEKSGYNFNLVKLNLNGQIIKPIELKAKSGPPPIS